MSDFIKVNFKSGNMSQAHKSTIKLEKYSYHKDGKKYFKYYCYSTHFFLEKIFECLFRDKCNLTESEYKGYYAEAKITREEYDRLCKELGVE